MAEAAKQTQNPVEIDSSKSYEDPHNYYRWLRSQAPVGVTDIGVHVVLRAEYLDTVMNDENTRQFELEGMMLRGITEGPLFDIYANAMLFANGDVHRRRRAPMARTFAFKLMDGMRPRIRAVAGELVEELRGEGPIDFLNRYGRAIPARIIAEIIGAPADDWPSFTDWVSDAARGIGFSTNEELPQIEAGAQALADYVEKLFAERRENPREDFLTDYLKTTDASDLNTDEIRTQMMGVILAGSDTTKTGICSVLSQLLQHPEQWALVCEDPDKWKKAAVDEGLRYDPPVGSIPRFALKEIDIGGVVIPANTVVSFSVLSALRDPDKFERPDEFDITRADQPRWHIAFGAGAHRCLGEALARAEMEETIATIARLAPDIRMIGKPPTIKSPAAIRHIDAMTVAFG